MRNPFLRSIPMIVVSLLAFSLANAEEPRGEWPGYRGPSHDGVSDCSRLVDSWPDAGPPVFWHRPLGAGYSSFAAAGDRVYTQTQTLYGQYVVCLELDAGKELWRHRYDWPFESAGMYPGPRATPTVHGGRVYFCGTDGLVGCLDADTGRRLWAVNLTKRFHGRGTDFGYSCSPVLVDGKVILPVGGEEASVVALTADSGAVAWKAGDQPASYCSIVPVSLGSRKIAVAYLENSLAGIDVAAGKLFFEHRYSHGYNEHAASPVYQEPYLMTMSAFKGGSTLYRLEETPAGGVAAIQVRSSKFLSNDVASSVLVDGCVYGFDLRDVQAKLHRSSRGEFRCVDMESGEVHWSSESVGHANVIAADGKLILFNDAGELILARARSDRYEELARTQVFSGEICWTAPALHRGRLLLRTQSQAACIYLGSSPPPQSKHLPVVSTSQLPKTPVVDAMALFVGGERAFPFDPPDSEEFRRWYAYSIALITVGAVLCELLKFLACVLRKPALQRAAPMLYWPLLMALCLVGTPLLNRHSEEFVFTWPASVYVAFLALLVEVVGAKKRTDQRRDSCPQQGAGARHGVLEQAAAKRRTRWAGLAFLAMCGLYFHFCKRFGLAMESVFLIGLLPGFPIAAFAAFRLNQRPHALERWFWTTAVVTACTASSAAYVRWLLPYAS